MRPLVFSRAPGQSLDQYVEDALARISEATFEDFDAVLEDFTVSNFTETRTLDVGSATSTDLANFVATLINDLKSRGQPE